jgi:hypothetical protein
MTLPPYDDTLEPDPDDFEADCPDCGHRHRWQQLCESALREARIQAAIDKAEERYKDEPRL